MTTQIFSFSIKNWLFTSLILHIAVLAAFAISRGQIAETAGFEIDLDMSAFIPVKMEETEATYDPSSGPASKGGHSAPRSPFFLPAARDEKASTSRGTKSQAGLPESEQNR